MLLIFKKEKIMFGFNKNKKPADRIRSADKSTQRLRDKRSKLDPISDEKKIKKINNKIHQNNVEKDIAYREIDHPKTEIKRTTNNTSFNYNKNDNSTQLHVHGHYHSSKKK